MQGVLQPQSTGLWREYNRKAVLYISTGLQLLSVILQHYTQRCAPFSMISWQWFCNWSYTNKLLVRNLFHCMLSFEGVLGLN